MKKQLAAGLMVVTISCSPLVGDDVKWDCAGDDQVMDSSGQCHDIDSYIDSYRDTIVLPDCEEDENWDAVHFQDPRGQEDSHGVTRACVHADG